MTFCLGITVDEGLVGIADTRITSGTEMITARKVSAYQNGFGAFFIMTSGLRSVRDKMLTYFEERLGEMEDSPEKLYRMVNLLAEELRRVAIEDREHLNAGGLHFNLHTLVGGQLTGDSKHRLFLIYPEGNWVEVGEGTPYYIIGEGGYGKPVLDRTLKHSDSLKFALKVGCLAFDSTRISASDVDFPIDVVLYSRHSHEIVEHRYEATDLAEISSWWQNQLRSSVNELPSEWVENIAAKLKAVTRRTGRHKEME
ncbi:peptidase [Desulfovibrio inopinatus]|uniref:peptidase n=1 Tax=Desulfovibrio inopinatus TaxID=102109 RepID=UPI000400A1B5|nr:peptidase [Desulfovibrio inopinatus]